MTTTAPPLVTRPVLERLRAVVRGELSLAPVAGLVGFSLTGVAEERATIEMEAGSRRTPPCC